MLKIKQHYESKNKLNQMNIIIISSNPIKMDYNKPESLQIKLIDPLDKIEPKTSIII